jgi:RNA polymerase sigma factor (TIGR02999 family)
VNECYLKLTRAQALKSLSRTEFVALACRAMRNVLIDRAREQSAQKRGGGQGRVTLKGLSENPKEEVDLLELDVALQKLALLDERQGRVVELRFFGGLTHEEIAEVLGCSPRTVNAEWALAKAWLHKELTRS